MVAPHVVTLRADSDVVAACMAARDTARRMGFSTTDQARIATATSELAQHLLHNTTEGCVIITQVSDGSFQGIALIFEEQTTPPSTVCPWSETMLSNHAVSGGLADSRRLMDAIQVETVVDVGTRVTCYKWLRY